MSKSSTAIGNEFESKIFELFSGWLSAGQLALKPECCKIYQKKGYYSRDRQKDIKFDISIEVFYPGSTSYSNLMLIECKNYSHSVPVDDVEEFFAKIQQVSGANVKGIIASTHAFQEGTLTFAKSKGIGLLRYFDPLNFKWVLHRSPSTFSFSQGLYGQSDDIHSGLISESYQSRRFDFYCCNGDTYTNSLPVFFLDLTRDSLDDNLLIEYAQSPAPSHQPVVEYVSQDDMERRVQEILKAIKYNEGVVPLDQVCAWQSKKTGLIVKTGIPLLENNRDVGILGRIQFNPTEISIFDDPASKVRQKFTLAHELGHHFLGHSKYMSGEYCEANDFELDEYEELSQDDIRRMEWQANCFASCLLLPKNSFHFYFLTLARKYGLKNRGFGILYIDEQNCNRANYYVVTNALKSRFQVSRSVVRLRLKNLGLLNEGRDSLKF